MQFADVHPGGGDLDDVEYIQANLDEARRSGNVEVSSRLQQVRDEVLLLLEQAAPPEVRVRSQSSGRTVFEVSVPGVDGVWADAMGLLHYDLLSKQSE